MFRVTVDTSSVVRIAGRIERKIARLPFAMQDAVERSGAQEARRNHGYRNRTHNLERSTAAYLVQALPNHIVVHLGPLAPYAKYVAARGFLSLERAKRMAKIAVDRLLAGIR